MFESPPPNVLTPLTFSFSLLLSLSLEDCRRLTFPPSVFSCFPSVLLSSPLVFSVTLAVLYSFSSSFKLSVSLVFRWPGCLCCWCQRRFWLYPW